MAGTSERDPLRTSGLADPTRDIRLPPLPGTQGPELPPEWEALRVDGETAEPEPSEALADQPTDQLGQPPQGDRDRTLTFSGTSAQRWAAGHPATPDPAWSSVPAAPAPVVQPRPRTERAVPAVAVGRADARPDPGHRRHGCLAAPAHAGLTGTAPGRAAAANYRGRVNRRPPAGWSPSP